jgi:hypothetical protein
MEPAEICISFTVAILGVAYPILLEVISRLDDKYSSTGIVDLFDKEKEKKYFSWLLIATVAAIVIWTMKWPRLVNIPSLNTLIDNSALILLTACTILLLVSFFYLIEKILTYYRLTKFVRYLSRKHKKEKADQPESDVYFKTIADVLFYAIRTQNIGIAKTIADFMYDAFRVFRQSANQESVEYPVAYYEMVHRAVEALASQRNRGLMFLEDRTAGSLWLLGELQDAKISEFTYVWIWRNLSLALSYEREDYVMYHWQHAHQHYNYQLQSVAKEYGADYSVLNSIQVEDRRKERQRFLEFHYMLGALLLYQRRYKPIKRMYEYTTSIPPRYELLPIGMGEIFYLYMEYRDPFNYELTHLSFRYYFPGIEGLQADEMIKRWFGKYLALLFIRQYSIVPYLVTIKPLAPPAIPSTQSDRKKWLSLVHYLKKDVEEILANRELLQQTELDFVTDEWCDENDKPKPLQLIEKIKQKLIDSIELTAVEEEIDLGKVEKFTTYTKETLTNTFGTFEKLNNPKDINENFKKWYINGVTQLTEKSTFANNQGVEHLNFHSFLTDKMDSRCKSMLSQTFAAISKVRYLFPPDQLIAAIEKLNLGTEQVIVCFNCSLANFAAQYQQALPKASAILELYMSYAGDAIFVVRKEDLPQLLYRDTKKEYIDESELKELDETYHIYASVVDLNRNENLRLQVSKEDDEQDYHKLAVMNIYVDIEIRWKTEALCAQLSIKSPFRQKGEANLLSEIQPLL